MDASAAVAALQSGDMTGLAAALEWDAVELFTIGDQPLVIARIGGRVVKATDDVLTLHDHGNESDATACYLATVEEVRAMAASPLTRMLAAMVQGDGDTPGDPLDPNTLVVPDYPAGFGWTV